MTIVRAQQRQYMSDRRPKQTLAWFFAAQTLPRRLRTASFTRVARTAAAAAWSRCLLRRSLSPAAAMSDSAAEAEPRSHEVDSPAAVAPPTGAPSSTLPVTAGHP